MKTSAYVLALIVAVIALVMWADRGYVHQAQKNDQQISCLLNAPLGWDCSRSPTGYPERP